MASETITASEIGTITLVNKTEIWLSYRYFATYFFQKFGAGKFEGVMKPGERVVTQFTGAGLVNRYLIIDPDQEVIPTPNSSYGHQVVDGMGAMDELTAGGLLEKGASHLYPKNDLDREKEYVLNENVNLAHTLTLGNPGRAVYVSSGDVLAKQQTQVNDIDPKSTGTITISEGFSEDYPTRAIASAYTLLSEYEVLHLNDYVTIEGHPGAA